MNLLKQYGADERRFTEASYYPDFHLARVISQYNELYKLVTADGECMAGVSGKFRYEAAEPSYYPAVGDYVLIDRTQDNSGNAVIHRVLPRKSMFARKAAGTQQQTQVVAANIDVVFLCMSLNQDYNLSRLERYLATAWDSGALPVVVLTKSDLCTDLAAALAEIEGIAPGTDVVAASSHDPSSWERLLAYLGPGVTASLIGSSGVGKSTLVNRLMGEEALSTSHIRRDDKGRHTTTRRELLLLPQGGVVIDTPGMRELGVESADLSRTFSDIDVLAEGCRFRDCTHEAEPGCAIRRALEEGTLDPRRLESYQKLKKEARYEGLSSRQIESEKLGEMFKDVGGMKNARKHIRQNDKRKGGR